MKRLAVLISGTGSNLQALIDAIDGEKLRAEIVVVVSSRALAFGVERAERAGLPVLVQPRALYRPGQRWRARYDADLAMRVACYRPDLLVLAGWMHIFGEAFLGAFPDRIVNLHPALPGAFPGLRAIERALEAYAAGQVDRTGVTVHRVVRELDAGPVLMQQEVAIHDNDDLVSLSARVHRVEHEILPRAVARALASLT